MSQLLLNILYVLIGCFATIIVARIYYEKAANELKFESDQLKHLNELILRAMEHAGLAEFTRDNKGKIIDLRLLLKISNMEVKSSIDHVVLTSNNTDNNNNKKI